MPFQKGQSGNPNGRPKKDQTLSDLLTKYLDGKDKVTNVKRKDLLIQKIVELALQGDVTSIKYIFDRVDGSPTSTVDLEHSGNIQLPVIRIVSEKE